MKPNFFIIGAPKAGTTSLAKWINDHPNGFVSKPKEPYFFNTDIGPRKTTSLEHYERLFSMALTQHEAIGEASTIYLQSTEAVRNILEYQPKARIIVMLRNPLEMVVSMHNQEIRSFNEDIADFEQAWRAQEYRVRGIGIPKGCIDPVVLMYRERARIGSHMRQVRRTVPDSQLCIAIFDDLVEDPGSVYRRVLQFLGLSDDGRTDFSPENRRGAWRSNTLQKTMRGIAATKNALGIRWTTGVLGPIGRWNRVRAMQTPLSSRLRDELADTFREEVDILSEECRRDLSHWLLDPKL